MTVILNEQDRWQVVLVCDICNARIEERDDGNVLFEPHGERQMAVIVHKGCDKDPAYKDWYWQPLSQAIWEWHKDLLPEGYEPLSTRFGL